MEVILYTGKNKDRKDRDKGIRYMIRTIRVQINTIDV